jgi:hypothetical protein
MTRTLGFFAWAAAGEATAKEAATRAARVDCRNFMVGFLGLRAAGGKRASV